MRKDKQFLLDEIKEKIDTSNGFILTKNCGILANDANDFRGEVEKRTGDYEVCRKRIFSKAAEACGLSIDHKTLDGHLGVVFFDEEPSEMAKMIYDFSKDKSDVLEVLGGVVEGKHLSSDEVKALSKLPSKDEMRAQLLGTLEAPMSQTLSVMQALLTSVIYCLDNKAKQEG